MKRGCMRRCGLVEGLCLGRRGGICTSDMPRARMLSTSAMSAGTARADAVMAKSSARARARSFIVVGMEGVCVLCRRL